MRASSHYPAIAYAVLQSFPGPFAPLSLPCHSVLTLHVMYRNPSQPPTVLINVPRPSWSTSTPSWLLTWPGNCLSSALYSTAPAKSRNDLSRSWLVGTSRKEAGTPQALANTSFTGTNQESHQTLKPFFSMALSDTLRSQHHCSCLHVTPPPSLSPSQLLPLELSTQAPPRPPPSLSSTSPSSSASGAKRGPLLLPMSKFLKASLAW